ncbi:MAG TPA: DUF4232 domain-containing protein [Pseudonocardiaceae bacterium]|nr:DUF4232 domain-containing protein [Pseudonocardiaceae bacterium]
MRVPTIVIACAAAAALLTACGSGGTRDTAASASTTPSATPTTTLAPAPSTTAPVTTTTTTTTAAPTTTKTATAAVFRVDLTVQRAGLGLLALTNASKRTVTVRGWATVRFYNAADELLAVPVKKVNVPGVGPSISIGPGETAFAGVRWQAGDKANPKTFVATTLRLTPPSGSAPVVVNVIGMNGETDQGAEFDLTSAEIGTLQPSSQGVLVF